MKFKKDKEKAALHDKQREADLAQYEEEQQTKAAEEGTRKAEEARNPKSKPIKTPYEAKELPQK